MEEISAIDALSALAHATRLRVFRLLIQKGPSGLIAGDIAREVQVPPSTLSTHLALLERAGLLRARRVDRRIFYTADYEGMRRLLSFLTEDCCQGRPEICGFLTETVEAC
ncbi:MAG: metalloregulator ArsR/SmtB family transcription factor [Pseudomonadota bacterium]